MCVKWHAGAAGLVLLGLAGVIGLLATPTRVVAAEADTSRGQLTVAVPHPIATLDPHVPGNGVEATLRLSFYDALLRWAGTPARLQPWVADRYEVAPDGLTYTFHLRSGVKFHDRRDLTAADVVYSVERFLARRRDAGSRLAAVLAPGATRAQGDDTVVFGLRHASDAFPALIANVAIVNRMLVGENEKNNDWGANWLSQTSAGSGGYFVVRHDPEEGVVAIRNRSHFSARWGAHPYDQVHFRVVRDATERVAAVRSGEIQVLVGRLPADQLAAMRASPGVRVVERPTLRMVRAAFHNRRAPTSDVNFRKALSYAFDYGGFVNRLLAGTVVRNGSPLPNLLVEGAPIAGYTYDIARARQFLAQVKEPLREISIGVVAGQPHAEMAAAVLQAGLEKLGVQSRVAAEPLAQIEARLRDEKQMYDVLFRVEDRMMPVLEPWIQLRYGCDSIGIGNFGWYCNRDVDALVTKARGQTDRAQQLATWRTAARIIEADAAGLWIGTATTLVAVARSVKGIYVSPASEGLDLRLASQEP